MRLRERYERELARCGYLSDPAQLVALAELQRVADALETIPRPGLWQRVASKLPWHEPEIEPARGLYLWGGVGRGKTWLVDMFYEHLPFPDKLRSHFHRFMYTVHDQLKSLRDQRDPLATVAARIADGTRVICFDELAVADIGDAMILGTLFAALFRRGVCLVATSNIAPDDLYRDGLQRSRFLPAIELIKRHTETLELDGAVDYRLRLLEQAEIYHWPLDAEADRNLRRYFEQIAPDTGEWDKSIEIEHRMIQTRECADGVVWFDFAQICGGPRSQADYIEIAREYQTVLVSNVPRMTAEDEDAARRFIALVDEFYDRNVKLILSAAVPLEQLYAGRRLAFEFARTRSRLEEMQSHEYLARPHLP